jgi:hypothetical protein
VKAECGPATPVVEAVVSAAPAVAAEAPAT